MSNKTLNITNQLEVKEKISDIEVFGKDLFLCASKASSKEQGWMKSTKICNLPNGMLVQVTTQQDNNVAEALEFVPGINYNFNSGGFIKL